MAAAAVVVRPRVGLELELELELELVFHLTPYPNLNVFISHTCLVFFNRTKIPSELFTGH
jgi:hypothetical protein